MFSFNCFYFPKVCNCGNKFSPQHMPGLFLTYLISQHYHGLQGLVPMTLSACGLLPSLYCNALAILQLIENTAYQKERKQRLQHCTEN